MSMSPDIRIWRAVIIKLGGIIAISCDKPLGIISMTRDNDQWGSLGAVTPMIDKHRCIVLMHNEI